jgi:hypothetical protein
MSEVSLINGHDDDMKIELENLKGEHTLSGIEVGEREFKNFWGHKEECGYIKFTLDGITYIAVEDPDDGYRSYMRDLEIVDEDCEIKLPDIKVCCKMREDDKGWNETNEVLEFIDLINCETILAIGTGNTSDYYPYCVLDYYPERMSCNADRNGHIDGCDTCVICGRDIPEGSQVCVICGKVGKGKQTHYDRIRNMNVEEMAKWLADSFGCSLCPEQANRRNKLFFNEDCDGKCEEHCKQWLESEVDTE